MVHELNLLVFGYKKKIVKNNVYIFYKELTFSKRRFDVNRNRQINITCTKTLHQHTIKINKIKWILKAKQFVI